MRTVLRPFVALVTLALLPACPRTEVRPAGLLFPADQALVAAGPIEVWVQGKGGSEATLSLDGVEVGRARLPACAGAAAMPFSVQLDPGAHRLVLSMDGYTVHRKVTAAGVRGAINRVEQAAAPVELACLGLKPATDALELEAALGVTSDGLNPARDAVLVALDDAVSAFGPLECEGEAGSRRCTASAASGAAAEQLQLTELSATGWRVALRGGPMPAKAGALWLRVGNDAAGVDLATGQRLARGPAELDVGRRTEAIIGPEGGALATVNANGVSVSLVVPPGALGEPTPVRLTPFARPALPGSTGARAAVALEPDGLSLAAPAKLGFGGVTFGADERVALVSSPLSVTALPGSSTAALASAELWHFSDYDVSALGQYYSWANEALAAVNQPTLVELQALEAQLIEQQRTGCTLCLSDQELRAKMIAAVGTLIDAACADSVANETIDEAHKLITVVQFGQRNMAPTAKGEGCAHALLQKLIDKDGEAARDNDPAPGLTDRSDPRIEQLLPNPNSDLCRASRAVDLARCLAFNDLEQRARNLVEQAFVARIGRIGLPQTTRVDDPKMTRLRELWVASVQLTFDPSAAAALRKLAAGLRKWLDDGKRLCSQGNAAGKDLLRVAEGWVTISTPDVLQVDPTLGRDITSAINGCIACTVDVTPVFSGASAGQAVQLSALVRCTNDQRVTWTVVPSTATVNGGVFTATKGGGYVITATSVANQAITGSAYVQVDCTARDFVGVWNVSHDYFNNPGNPCTGNYGAGKLTLDYVDGGATDQVSAVYNWAGYTPTGQGKCETVVTAQISSCSLSGYIGPSDCHYMELSATLTNGKLVGSASGRTGPTPCNLILDLGFRSP